MGNQNNQQSNIKCRTTRQQRILATDTNTQQHNVVKLPALCSGNLFVLSYPIDISFTWLYVLFIIIVIHSDG